MTNSLQPAYALVPGANLEAYVHTVNSIPLLTPEQEREPVSYTHLTLPTKA